MSSSRVVSKVVAALVEQVPYLGPVFKSVRDEIGRERFESEVIELLHQIARMERPRHVAGPDGRTKRRLLVGILEGDAALANRLVPGGTSTGRNRFVYLAAAANASEAHTYEIALEYQFLWRTYHKVGGQSINQVESVGVGDLILLGYRANGGFHVSLPLVVKEAGPHTRPVGPANACRAHHHAPFAIADEELSAVLAGEGYRRDPILDAQVGLNVDPLEVDLTDERARVAMDMDFPSPGIDSVWPLASLERKEGYRQICDWLASL